MARFQKLGSGPAKLPTTGKTGTVATVRRRCPWTMAVYNCDTRFIGPDNMHRLRVCFRRSHIPDRGEERSSIMASSLVHEFTSENWQKEVMESSIPVLVDFWAVWCGPCRALAPTIDELAKENEGKIKVGKLNVDDAQDIASQYRVNSIPQIFIFKNGQVAERIVGAERKPVFQSAIKRVLEG